MDDLLVATVNGLFLVQDGLVWQLAEGDHYGLTWDRQRLYAAYRKGARIRSWDGQGEWQIVECPHRQNDVHQILWWDGVLYVAHSGADQIDAWDGAEWQTLWQGTGDGREHVNSIWYGFDRFWVVEHRFGREPARVRMYDAGFGLVKTHEFYDLAHDHNCGLHNVYLEDGRLYTLSVDRMIIRDLIDGVEGTWKLGGYLRGLARTENHWYVGQSRISERDHRAKGDAEVLVLDGRFHVLTGISIRDAGQIHDIRALKGDRAHNGLDCPLEMEDFWTPRE